MHEDILSYWDSLWRDIPYDIYIGGLSILCICAVLLLAKKGLTDGLRYIGVVILLEYAFVVYCSTVIFRHTSQDEQCNLIPLWSYLACVKEGSDRLLVENMMNVVVFVPVGVLWGYVSREGWKSAVSVGAGLSIGIELLQFIFKRGFAEVDDVIHNTIGCMIGYAIYKGTFLIYKKISISK